MVDSGASVTTVSKNVAQAAGIPITFRRVMVNTANGQAWVTKSRADTLQVGPIERTDFPVDVNETDDINLLGMNFLSSLESWRVEGNYLVLQAVTNGFMLGGLYILMAMMLVLGALMSRRERPAKLLTMALAWVAIFAGGFVLFTFRDDLGWVAQRLRAEATGEPVAQGEEIRIPMAIDGHFWVDGQVNGDGQVPGRQRRDDDDDRPRHGGARRRSGQSDARIRSSAPAMASSASRAARRDVWRSARSSATNMSAARRRQ